MPADWFLSFRVRLVPVLEWWLRGLRRGTNLGTLVLSWLDPLFSPLFSIGSLQTKRLGPRLSCITALRCAPFGSQTLTDHGGVIVHHVYST